VGPTDNGQPELQGQIICAVVKYAVAELEFCWVNMQSIFKVDTFHVPLLVQPMFAGMYDLDKMRCNALGNDANL